MKQFCSLFYSFSLSLSFFLSFRLLHYFACIYVRNTICLLGFEMRQFKLNLNESFVTNCTILYSHNKAPNAKSFARMVRRIRKHFSIAARYDITRWMQIGCNKKKKCTRFFLSTARFSVGCLDESGYCSVEMCIYFLFFCSISRSEM